jgi:hypothetical protein
MVDALFTLEYFRFAGYPNGTGSAAEGFERVRDNCRLYSENR